MLLPSCQILVLRQIVAFVAHVALLPLVLLAFVVVVESQCEKKKIQ
jgi:hypothetical protein